MKTGPEATGLDPSPAAFIRLLSAGVIVVNLFVVVLVSFMLNRSYHGRLDRAALTARNLTQVLEENIAGDIDKIDLALLSVLDEVTRQVSAGGIDGQTIDAFLIRQKSRLPDADSIRISDSRGIVRYGPGVSPASRVDLSDRDFFIRTRDDPAAGLLISKPVFARISKKWVLPIARRLNRPDGSFLGVVYANIALDRLTRIFQGVDVGTHGAIALFDSDRGIVVRYPEPGGLGSSVGKKFISPQIRKLFHEGREAATYDGRSSIDGLERTFSYRKVSGYPLYVSVGLAKDDYLARWHDEAAETAALAALFLLISSLSAWAIYRSWNSQVIASGALHESEQKYRALIETTNTGYVILDTMGNVLDANPEYANLTGQTSVEEVVGKNVVEWTAHEDRERNAREVKKCLECGYVRNLEIHYTGRDGVSSPVEINATVIRDGDESRILSICRDISERKKMETEIIKIQKLESVGILAGGIAHDFNNLLQSIVGNVGLAKMNAKPGDKIFERLNKVEEAAAQATELSYRLLTFSKGGEPIRRIAGIEKLLRESLSLSLSGSNIKGSIDLADDLYAEIDEGQIIQVFNNLFINAREAMPDGGTVRVTGGKIEVGQEDGLPLKRGLYLKISVQDNGVGISEKNLPMIFDPYFSTKGLGSVKGTGLGLAVCHSVIKKHAGYISVESEEGKGTTFHVYLPAAGDASPEKKREKAEPSASKRRLLLMDDDERVLTVAGDMLEYLGYEVDTVKSGEEAIEQYRTAKDSGTPYEAVILDLTVQGGMGGDKALVGLLKVDPSVKAIISSGYADEQIMKDFRDHGFAAAISKPYSIERLLEMLERLE